MRAEVFKSAHLKVTDGPITSFGSLAAAYQNTRVSTHTHTHTHTDGSKALHVSAAGTVVNVNQKTNIKYPVTVKFDFVNYANVNTNGFALWEVRALPCPSCACRTSR